MQAGDLVIFYSPKLEYDKPEKLQCFTAIGKVADENIYQADMGGGFIPFRRNVTVGRSSGMGPRKFIQASRKPRL